MPGTMSANLVRHSNRVDDSNIRAYYSTGGRQSADFRYLLKIPYSERSGGDVVCVVLKNPSAANELYADRTIRRVEEYVWRRFGQCKQLLVLNLYAYRSTAVGDLWQRMTANSEVVGVDNDDFLRGSFQRSSHIICAWGKPTDAHATQHAQYCSRIDEVAELLQPHAGKLQQVAAAGAATLDRFPLHGLRWGYSMQTSVFSIVQ